MAAMICMYRIQDLEGRDDDSCISCWRDSRDCNGMLVNSYLARDACMDEFLVTEAEFDEIERKRREREAEWQEVMALYIAPGSIGDLLRSLVFSVSIY